MSNIDRTIFRIFALTKKDIKPILGMMVKLQEEVGELAEAVLLDQGLMPHKTMKEPLVGEVADVIQCALAVLAAATPKMNDDQRLSLIDEYLRIKTDKWESVQPRNPDAVESIGQQVTDKQVTATDRGITRDLQQRLADILATRAVVKPAIPAPSKIKLAPKKAVKKTPKVYVNVRMHPTGVTQPLGLRKVFRMERKQNMIEVGLGPDGMNGWSIDLFKAQPKWIDFRIGTSAKNVTLAQAVDYWNSML